MSWGWQLEAARRRDRRRRWAIRAGAWIGTIAIVVALWLAAFTLTAFGLGIWHP